MKKKSPDPSESEPTSPDKTYDRSLLLFKPEPESGPGLWWNALKPFAEPVKCVHASVCQQIDVYSREQTLHSIYLEV